MAPQYLANLIFFFSYKKGRFSLKIALCSFYAFQVFSLHEKDRKKLTSQFSEISVTDRQSEEQMDGRTGLCRKAGVEKSHHTSLKKHRFTKKRNLYLLRLSHDRQQNTNLDQDLCKI